MLPMHAKAIAEARQRGERPELPVFLTLGQLGVKAAYPDNFCAVVPSNAAISKLDLGWCVGLDIEIAGARLVGNERAMALIEAVVASDPRNLVVWETETGMRWWLVDACGPWPKSYRMHECDWVLMPKAEAHETRA